MVLRRRADLRGLRARQVTEADLAEFDYVLAMDQDNFKHLLALCPDPEWRNALYCTCNNASKPSSSCIGFGGQPGICRSTGITSATPPTQA